MLTVLLGRWEDVSDRGGGGGEHGRRGDHPNLSHPQALVKIAWKRYFWLQYLDNGRHLGKIKQNWQNNNGESWEFWTLSISQVFGGFRITVEV